MLSMFSLIPNISTYVQGNLDFPRESMDTLYFYGGLCSFAIMYPVGRLTDKFGSAIVGTIGTIVFCITIYLGFVQRPSWFSVIFLFSTFMMCGSLRNVPTNTLTSRVPGASERARFMSIQSAVQHMSSAAGAFLSTILLSESSDHRLIGIERLGIISICLASTAPFLLFQIQKRVGRVTPAQAPAKTS